MNSFKFSTTLTLCYLLLATLNGSQAAPRDLLPLPSSAPSLAARPIYAGDAGNVHIIQQDIALTGPENVQVDLSKPPKRSEVPIDLELVQSKPIDNAQVHADTETVNPPISRGEKIDDAPWTKSPKYFINAGAQVSVSKITMLIAIISAGAILKFTSRNNL